MAYRRRCSDLVIKLMGPLVAVWLECPMAPTGPRHYGPPLDEDIYVMNAVRISGPLTRRARVLLWDEVQPVGRLTVHGVVCVQAENRSELAAGGEVAAHLCCAAGGRLKQGSRQQRRRKVFQTLTNGPLSPL